MREVWRVYPYDENSEIYQPDAGFVAVNQGHIRDCYADARVKQRDGAAGFVYENGASVAFCLAMGRVVGKQSLAGFCRQNRGKLDTVGYWQRADDVSDEDGTFENEQAEAAAKAKRRGYVDEPLTLYYRDAERRLRALGFGTAWVVRDGRAALDRAACRHSVAVDGDVIEITSAKQLHELAAAIASGDERAASSNYRLGCDVNLKGKTIVPIGVSESLPFKGTFDGAGHTVHNFKVVAKETEAAGLFGYIKDGTVANLDIDCVVNAKGGMFTGALCGVNGGRIINRAAVAKVGADKNCGGFCGKNYGEISYCSFVGAVTPVVPVWMWLLPALLLAFLLLLLGLILLLGRMDDTPYQPIVIDPGSAPVIEKDPVTPTTPGTSLISLNLNRDVYVNVEPDPTSGRQVGVIDCHNPMRSTENIVLRIMITDAELLAHGIEHAGMSAEAYAARSAEPDYDATKAYQEMFRSGLIPIGYNLSMIGLSPLANGTYLPEGEYEMMAVLDPYHPETNEKSVVNAEAPIAVYVVRSVEPDAPENESGENE